MGKRGRSCRVNASDRRESGAGSCSDGTFQLHPSMFKNLKTFASHCTMESIIEPPCSYQPMPKSQMPVCPPPNSIFRHHSSSPQNCHSCWRRRPCSPQGLLPNHSASVTAHANVTPRLFSNQDQAFITASLASLLSGTSSSTTLQPPEVPQSPSLGPPSMPGTLFAWLVQWPILQPPQTLICGCGTSEPTTAQGYTRTKLLAHNALE